MCNVELNMWNATCNVSHALEFQKTPALPSTHNVHVVRGFTNGVVSVIGSGRLRTSYCAIHYTHTYTYYLILRHTLQTAYLPVTTYILPTTVVTIPITI